MKTTKDIKTRIKNMIMQLNKWSNMKSMNNMEITNPTKIIRTMIILIFHKTRTTTSCKNLTWNLLTNHLKPPYIYQYAPRIHPGISYHHLLGSSIKPPPLLLTMKCSFNLQVRIQTQICYQVRNPIGTM